MRPALKRAGILRGGGVRFESFLLRICSIMLILCILMSFGARYNKINNIYGGVRINEKKRAV